MFELVIIRHAIAFERDSRRWHDDGLRPLTPEGKRKFRNAAAGLARWMPRVDELLTSPLTRAQQTANLLTDVAGWPKATARTELRPDHDPETLLTALRMFNSPSRVAVVGHQPYLGALVALCVGGAPTGLQLEMKKGAMAFVAFSRQVRAGSGALIALIPPRALRQMA